MNTKVLGIGLAALIIGVLGGYMIGTNKPAETMTDDKMMMMVQDPVTSEKMIDAMMENETSRNMIMDRVAQDTQPDGMYEDTMEEGEKMMKPTGAMTDDNDTMMKEDEGTMMEKNDAMMEK